LSGSFERIAGVVRLTHPFPSLLVALTTGALALLASGDPAAASRLAFAMIGIQFSIGALNDLVDAPLDAGRKPGKPIPRGAATRSEARAITLLGLALGLGLTLPSGPVATGVLALAALCGYAYDLWLSRTVVSWVPLALALPIVPVYAWLGSTGQVPPELVAILPAAILAGAGLALANALADIDRDRDGRTASAAVALGPSRTWLIQAALLVVAIGLVVAARPTALLGSGAGVPPGGFALLAGLAAVVAGIGLARGGGAARRERAWELEALGVALVGAGWLASLGAPG
jgi:4-hydroxybenzoate polyprenyltransferase